MGEKSAMGYASCLYIKVNDSDDLTDSYAVIAETNASFEYQLNYMPR